MRSRVWGVWGLVFGLVLTGSAAAATAGEGGSIELDAELGAVKVRWNGRSKKLASLSDDLSPGLVASLNRWVPLAEEWGMTVALPEQAQVLFLGRCEDDFLDEGVDTADETWELFADLQPSEPREDSTDGKPPRPSVFFLFDREAHDSEAWPRVLDHMVAKQMLVSQAAASLRNNPNSLTQRDQRYVLQSTYDMAGDASAGDDEFRMNNEIAHKLVWMMLADRFGHVPDSLRWGLGYVAEQRLFKSIYQFNATGFVAAVDHFDWPKKTREQLGKARKLDDFDLVEEMLREDAVGRAQLSQMLAWGGMDYLLHLEIDAMVELFDGLAALHNEKDTYHVMQRYAGDKEQTEELMRAAFDDVEPRDLEKYLKRVK